MEMSLLLSLLCLHLLLKQSITVNSCHPISCKFPERVFSVEYPFRVKDRQPESCGRAGFDLYCDTNSTGPLLHLPDSISLRVNEISYNSQRIILSDPDDCLPRKLMSLNLSKSPFGSAWMSKKFWVYNCSTADKNDTNYDRIDCVSGSNYSVISSTSDVTTDHVLRRLNCTFLKVLTVPVSDYFTASLSNISTIYLSWNGGNDFAHKFPVLGWVMGLLGMVFGVVFCCCCIRLSNHYMEPTAPTSVNSNVTSTVSTEVVVVAGLDQTTIDSYPVVVVGESGRLTKLGDETCSICLSDYHAKETLKMLPQCLHLFHAHCIDQWLRSKGICPICRTSPPRLL